MRVLLLCVGKARERDAARLHDRYADRLNKLGVAYETDHVADVRGGGLRDDHVREREARAILERLERKAVRGTVVALDSTGDLLTSEQLAAKLAVLQGGTVTFVIGGPLGLHPLLHERADWIWSLSPLTFPHELVRSLVAEQLYRAVTLRRGIPYHK